MTPYTDTTRLNAPNASEALGKWTKHGETHVVLIDYMQGATLLDIYRENPNGTVTRVDQTGTVFETVAAAADQLLMRGYQYKFFTANRKKIRQTLDK